MVAILTCVVLGLLTLCFAYAADYWHRRYEWALNGWLEAQEGWDLANRVAAEFKDRAESDYMVTH